MYFVWKKGTKYKRERNKDTINHPALSAWNNRKMEWNKPTRVKKEIIYLYLEEMENNVHMCVLATISHYGDEYLFHIYWASAVATQFQWIIIWNRFYHQNIASSLVTFLGPKSFHVIMMAFIHKLIIFYIITLLTTSFNDTDINKFMNEFGFYCRPFLFRVICRVYVGGELPYISIHSLLQCGRNSVVCWKEM